MGRVGLMHTAITRQNNRIFHILILFLLAWTKNDIFGFLYIQRSLNLLPFPRCGEGVATRERGAGYRGETFGLMTKASSELSPYSQQWFVRDSKTTRFGVGG
jgi:hypothetical protein